MGISEVLQPESLVSGYPFDRILVPLDGSGSAERVLPVVRSLCRQHASQIILVRVVEPEPGVPARSLDRILAFTETKTVWHTKGLI